MDNNEIKDDIKNKDEIFKDIHKQMRIISQSLEEGKIATLNTEILIAQIKGNLEVEADARGLDAVSKYYINVFEKIKSCESIINNDLLELEKLNNK
jgi:hypothetical protein